MDRTIVIGITGGARHGKDTLASNIGYELRHDGISYIISPMADPIKLMIGNVLFPFFNNKVSDVDDALYSDAKDQEVPGLGVTPRRMLQTLGTEWGRTIRDDLWILHKQRTIEFLEGRVQVIIIPDIRFDNEATLCDIMIRVNRPHYKQPLDMDSCGHSSERGISPHLIDITVTNDSDLDDFRNCTPEIVDSIADVWDRANDERKEDDAVNDN